MNQTLHHSRGIQQLVLPTGLQPEELIKVWLVGPTLQDGKLSLPSPSCRVIGLMTLPVTARFNPT